MGDDNESSDSLSLNSCGRKKHRHRSRGRSRHSKQKKKRKTSSASFSSSPSDYDDDSDEHYSRRKKRHSHRDKRHKKKKHKKHHAKSKHRYYSDDESSSLSNHKKRKKHRLHNKKETKKNTKNEGRERRKDNGNNLSNDDKALENNVNFAIALKELFTSHMGLAMELPYMFIQLGQGRSINLKQMSTSKTNNCHANDDVQTLLSKVFSSLTSFGLEYNGDTWSWIHYKPQQSQIGASKTAPDLILLRISRILLDELGITHQAVEKYDQKQPLNEPKKPAIDSNKSGDGKVSSSEIQALTKLLLQKFTSKKDTDNSNNGNSDEKEETSIAKGLAGMCQMIKEDEIISIDNIPDEGLRKALETLFVMIGLIKEEMDPDNDENSNNDEEQTEKAPPSYGFVLPDDDVNETNNIVCQHLNIVIDTCVQFNDRHKEQPKESKINSGSSRKRILGPFLPSPSSQLPSIPDQISRKDVDLLCVEKEKTMAFKEESEEEEELGPSPFTNSSRVQRVPIRASMPSGNTTRGEDDGTLKREEWMMTPGEHDFLKGVISSGGLRSRTFQNKKSSRNISDEAEVLNPQVQAEMNAIKQAYADSRGPSLIDQHRQQKKEEEEAKKKNNNNQKEFSWSRETDLDKGRRVDKNALRMVLGGAAEGLKDKFRGSF